MSTQVSAPKSAYPTEAELGAFMVSANLIELAPADGVLGGYLQAAVDQFERSTGWVPFLAEASAQTYFYDPPEYGARLDFNGGFLSIDDVYTGYSDSSDGTLLTSGSDYDFLSYNYSPQGLPITGIRFIASPGRQDRSIKIVGRKGYSASIPHDVFQAILGKASALASAFVLPTAAASKIKQGPVEFDFGNRGGTIQQFETAFIDTVSRYMRIFV